MRRQIIISLKCVVTFFMVAWWSNIQANPCFIGENASDTLAQPVAIPDTAAGVGAVYTEVEVRPDFSYYDMHGVEAFRSYAQNRLNYPEFESESDIRGKIYVSFIVEVDGRISTIKVVRSFNDFFDIYAIRAVAGSPRWIPGKQGGVPVRVKYTIPLTVEIR